MRLDTPTRQPQHNAASVHAADTPPAPGRTRREFRLIVGGLGLVLLVLAIRQSVGLAGDDAFITYRYACNLRAGMGFVYNAGERVLGTTAPLYALLLAPVGRDVIPFVSNTLSCVAVALQGWAVGLILRALGTGSFAAAGAGLFLAGGGLGSHWHAGMETNVLVALLLWSCLALLSERWVIGGVLAGLATLCRPDAVLFAVLLVVGAAVRVRWRVSRVWPWVLAYTATVAPWLGFATWYFGSPVPRSLVTKMGSVPGAEYALSGALALARAHASFLYEHSPTWLAVWAPPRVVEWAWLAMITILYAIGFVGASQRQPGLTAPLLLPGLLLASYALIGPPVAHSWHLYPAVVVLYLGAVHGLLDLARRFRPGGLGRASLAWAGMVAVALAGFVWLLRFPDLYRTDIYFGPRAHAWAEMGQLLRTRATPDGAVSAKEIGIIGYFYSGRIVDRSGIVTPGLYYHSPALRTSLLESVRRYPSRYVVAEWSELPAFASMGLYEIIATTQSRGYLPFFLLGRRSASASETATDAAGHPNQAASRQKE